MKTLLIAQEVYLLERYSSLAYYKEMMEAFAALVATTEQALEQFMQDLLPDYRSRHQSMQPDIVWGERVIPNLREALEGVRNGWIHLQAGNYSALSLSTNVSGSFAAIVRDYDTEWMSQEFQKQYRVHRIAASIASSNIDHTVMAQWPCTYLSAEYSPDAFGELNPPESWPVYRLNPAVNVSTSANVPQTGIYLPDLDNSSPQFLIEGSQAWEATVVDVPGTEDWRRQPTTWTLIERIADSGGSRGWGDETAAPEASERIRVEGGQSCPESGYYFTPARDNSRRYFEAGVIMPSLGSDYGMTIWQWDPQQA
jgi:hypothetical protein